MQVSDERKAILNEITQLIEIQKELARRTMANFSLYVDKEMEMAWFHKELCLYLDKWIGKDIKKLAIFVPPQHGKSRKSSIETPAKILGMHPSAKIVVASYSDDNASRFNRACQNIIDSEEYRSLYPNTILPAKGIESTNELRNNTLFETVKYKGFYKAVSIGGSLTGLPVDYGIIDDPIKDRKQADSLTYRNNLWNWYNDVFKTRLHNDSSQLLLFTRWHEDDLAGRLFDPKNKYYDEEEASEWTIICLQAVKEPTLPIKGAININDPREVGEALWPSKHSREKYERRKKNNPLSFASLDQQRPTPEGGNLIKRDWFTILKPSELPFNPLFVSKDFWIDGAFTEKMQNDESAQMVCSFYMGNLYIFNAHGVRKELNEYLEYIVPFMKSSGYRATSNVFIEPKASGEGFISMLKQPKYGSFNTRRINSKTVAAGKLVRAKNAQPTLASGKVFLIEGGWNEAFITQCCNFPNDVHDDMLDLVCYAIDEYFIQDEDVDVTYS